MKTVYVDNNATTAVAPEVYEAMVPFFKEEYFNPSSMYEASRKAANTIEDARKAVSKLLRAGNPKQILFTSCASESNNTAIFGVAKANPHKKHIITTAVEHPAVLDVCKDMARSGYEVTFLPVDSSGNLDVTNFVRTVRPDTLLVTIMHANNETGVVFPIENLSRLVKETNQDIVFHTDATQSVGKLSIDLSGNFKHVDLLSFSGHKMHAPKGVGALFIRKGTPCRPLLIGGHQEGGRRAGTENVPYIAGLAKACELAQQNMADEERVAQLRDRLQAALLEKIPYLEVNGANAPRLPNTLNVACHYIEGEGILQELSEHGICASSGSVYVGFARAVSRAEGNGRSVHRDARLGSVQLEQVHDRRGSRSHHRCVPSHSGKSPQGFPLLGQRQQQTQRGRRYGIRDLRYTGSLIRRRPNLE